MLDKINLRILKALSNDARISYSELAKMVYLSSPAVADRIKKLEASGVILGYKPVLNLETIGIAIEALIECEIHKGKERELKAYLLTLDSVIKIYNITGVTTFIVHVGVTKMSDLDLVIEGLIDYCDTNTKMIMNKPFFDVIPQNIEAVLDITLPELNSNSDCYYSKE